MTDTHEELTTFPLTERGRRPREEEGPTVILPLDGSSLATMAFPVAKALADLEGGTLHVVHAAERLVAPRELAGQLGLSPGHLAEVVIDELAGDPAEAIISLVRETAEPRLVMVAYARTLAAGHELGPVTERVLGEVDCPVVLVRPQHDVEGWELGRMLLPHDGAPHTAEGFAPAARLAERAEAEVYVLHVATLSGTPEPGTLPVPPYVDQPQHEWPEWTREFLDRMEVFTGLSPELEPRLFLSKGAPGAEILRYADERHIDLIALSWHGSLASEHAATLKEVILSAPCPVLFLRAPAPRSEVVAKRPPLEPPRKKG